MAKFWKKIHKLAQNLPLRLVECSLEAKFDAFWDKKRNFQKISFFGGLGHYNVPYKKVWPPFGAIWAATLNVTCSGNGVKYGQILFCVIILGYMDHIRTVWFIITPFVLNWQWFKIPPCSQPGPNSPESPGLFGPIFLEWLWSLWGLVMG